MNKERDKLVEITDKIRSYNMDCMEFMQEKEDNAFDLAIVDPPYFESYAKSNYTGSSVSCTGIKRDAKHIKHWKVPDQYYFKELFRVSKNQIIWGVNYYAKYISDVGRIIWDKRNESSTFSDCEIASHSFGIIVNKFSHRWNGMLQEDMKDKQVRIHKSEKPIALYKWLLDKYAKPDDRILDTHGGSMSIGIACHDYDFELDICELDKDYFQAATKRLQNHVAQKKLF